MLGARCTPFQARLSVMDVSGARVHAHAHPVAAGRVTGAAAAALDASDRAYIGMVKDIKACMCSTTFSMLVVQTYL